MENDAIEKAIFKLITEVNDLKVSNAIIVTNTSHIRDKINSDMPKKDMVKTNRRLIYIVIAAILSLMVKNIF